MDNAQIRLEDYLLKQEADKTESAVLKKKNNIIIFPYKEISKELGVAQTQLGEAHTMLGVAHTELGEAKHNYIKGGEQRVYPIVQKEQLDNMVRYLMQRDDKKYVLAFILGVNLGLRANELLALKQSDIFFKDGSIKYIENIEDTSDGLRLFQSKTSKYRKVFLNKGCVEVIDWYFSKCSLNYKARLDEGNDKFLFPSREGGHIKTDTLRKVLKDAAKECGIHQNIGSHSLRKTFARHEHNVNPETVYGDISFLQHLLGHSSASITMRYLGFDEIEDKSAYHQSVLSFKDILI